MSLGKKLKESKMESKLEITRSTDSGYGYTIEGNIAGFEIKIEDIFKDSLQDILCELSKLVQLHTENKNSKA